MVLHYPVNSLLGIPIEEGYWYSRDRVHFYHADTKRESVSETLDPLSDCACRMTHAYKTGIKLSERLQDGESLRAAVSEVTIYMEHLEDGYPNWHPPPDSFRGMIRLSIY